MSAGGEKKRQANVGGMKNEGLTFEIPQKNVAAKNLTLKTLQGIFEPETPSMRVKATANVAT